MTKSKFKVKKHKYSKIHNGGSKTTIIKNKIENKNNCKIANCSHTNFYFNNIKGTCWMISVFMIVLMNNEAALKELETFTEEKFRENLKKTNYYSYLK